WRWMLMSVVDNTLRMRIAGNRLSAYSGEFAEWKNNHAVAMECRDCEEFIAIGIKAFRSIENAEKDFWELANADQVEYTTEAQSTIDMLYQSWMAPCESVKAWAAS